MTSTALPRLENNASNRQTAIGWFQVIIGGSAIIGVPVLLLFQKLLYKFVDLSSPLSLLMWILFVFGCWAISVGLNRLTVNSTFRRLHPRMNGGEFTIEKHAELVGVSPRRLLDDLGQMYQRKYWDSMAVLDDAIVITPKTTKKEEKHYKILAQEGMRFFTKQQGNRIPQMAIVAFFIGLFFVLPLPFLKIIWVIAAFALSFPIHRISSGFTPKHSVIQYNKIPQYVPDKIELELSGNEQADELIRQAENHLIQLQGFEHSIKDEHLHSSIVEISTGTAQMVDRLRKSPDKHRQVRQTLNYSLPTAIDLFHKYEELDAQPVKGDNIRRSMEKIHEMSDLVAATFKRELDAMYQDQTLDIEVDIEVMKNMIQNEELDFSPMAAFRRGEESLAPANAEAMAPETSSNTIPIEEIKPILTLPEDEE